jgi:hypothetical protein
MLVAYVPKQSSTTAAHQVAVAIMPADFTGQQGQLV